MLLFIKLMKNKHLKINFIVFKVIFTILSTFILHYKFFLWLIVFYSRLADLLMISFLSAYLEISTCLCILNFIPQIKVIYHILNCYTNQFKYIYHRSLRERKNNFLFCKIISKQICSLFSFSKNFHIELDNNLYFI